MGPVEVSRRARRALPWAAFATFTGFAACAALTCALGACAADTPGKRRAPSQQPDASRPDLSDTSTPDAGSEGGKAADASVADAAVDDDGTAGQPAPQCEVRTGPSRPWRMLHGGELLGAHIIAADQVKLSIFAPNAREVTAMGDFNAWDLNATPLTRAPDGVWSTTLSLSQPEGTQYRFVVDGRSVADPYSFANDENEGNSIVVDRSYEAFSDADFVRPAREALVIYEVNVSDFSRDASSGVSEPQRGKFAGFEAKIAHLRRLGVNAVELMPVVENQSDGYSWGYNASLFFAPESALASSSQGQQVRELKHLINALHDAGIAVIVDVVYNHVWGKTGTNHFWGVDPLYYFDYDDDGDAEDDKLSWGYKMASWREGVKKLMYDNMKYLMSEYHIDGFRLDSTENMDIEAVLDVIGALDDDGYCDRYYFVEEFSAAHNQRIRAHNAKLGRTLISSWGTGYKNRVWDAIRWKAGSMTDLTNVTYYSRGDGWNRSDEVIQYATSHDEGTLSTRFSATTAQVKAAVSHLLTAPGIPMLWAGEEMMRVHWGNYHPSGAGHNVREENNRLDWALAEQHADLIDYYAALIRLRTAHPTLHRALNEAVGDSFVWNNNNPRSALGYVRKAAPGDRDFVVLINYQDSEQTYKVAFPNKGSYRLMAANGMASSDDTGLSTLQVDEDLELIKVAGQSATIFMGE